MSLRTDATRRTVTRTPATVIAYRQRYVGLCRLADVQINDLLGAVRWFAGGHNRWVKSTIRQYRAALLQVIEDSQPDLPIAAAEELSAILKLGPKPRQSGPPRTSAKKRKSVPKSEFGLLLRHLRNRGRHPDDRLAARLLNHNVRLFLRPSEWRTAILQGNILVVRNGKATNGRALGFHRRLDLTDYGPEGVNDLSKLLAVLQKQAQTAEGFRRLWGRLASRIARACKEIGIKRLAPYTTRHIGMANAKSWMSPEEVAATAGHKTTATASSHYAKRRTAWRSKPSGVARPLPEDVAKVIGSRKVSREANLEFMKNREERMRDGPAGDTPTPPF